MGQGLCQGLKIKLEKLEYKVNDTIALTFETNVNVDSVDKIDLSQFEIIDGLSTNSTISKVNGITSNSYSMTLKISSIKPGKIKIIAPAIYNAGKKISGEEKYIEVTGKALTSEELKKREFKMLVNKSEKPKGTRRFIINEDMGYVELFNGTLWVYERKLTTEEIQILKDVAHNN
jgi:hypothetical protein